MMGVSSFMAQIAPVCVGVGERACLRACVFVCAACVLSAHGSGDQRVTAEKGVSCVCDDGERGGNPKKS